MVQICCLLCVSSIEFGIILKVKLMTSLASRSLVKTMVFRLAKRKKRNSLISSMAMSCGSSEISLYILSNDQLNLT